MLILEQEEKPDDISEEDWESVKLARQLQEEETREMMRERAKILRALNDMHTMRALEASHNIGEMDPNQSINLDNVNPDNMTYEVEDFLF